MEGKLSKESVLKLSEEQKVGEEGGISTYKVEFIVDSDFGTPGAVTVVNGYENEFFLETITIAQDLHFACKSWLQPNHKRTFFINKVTTIFFLSQSTLNYNIIILIPTWQL